MGKCPVAPIGGGGGSQWVKLGERAVTNTWAASSSQTVDMPDFVDAGDYDIIMIRLTGHVTMTGSNYARLLIKVASCEDSYDVGNGTPIDEDAALCYYNIRHRTDNYFVIPYGATTALVNHLMGAVRMSIENRNGLKGASVDMIETIYGVKYQL